MTTQQSKRLWIASESLPVKQSNYGTYRTSVRTGEGMNLISVRITAATSDLAKEVAHNAATASTLLAEVAEFKAVNAKMVALLTAARDVVQMVDDAECGQLDLLSGIDAAITRATSINNKEINTQVAESGLDTKVCTATGEGAILK